MALKRSPLWRNAAIISRATQKFDRVVLRTKVGVRRILEAPVGDPVPRICWPGIRSAEQEAGEDAHIIPAHFSAFLEMPDPNPQAKPADRALSCSPLPLSRHVTYASENPCASGG